ncbi:MAG: PQQ-binding-like beta-propeller repeat protein [Candidatus Omnitrophota bacterium]
MSDEKTKHLEFIQNIITRTNTNSFQIKKGDVMKNLLICTSMLLCLLFSTYPVIADWPTVGQNYQNTFKAVDSLPEGTYVPVWEYTMPSPDFSINTTVITGDDKLFFGIRNYTTGTNTVLQCMDVNTHDIIWTFDTPYFVMTHPTVHQVKNEANIDEGRVYFAANTLRSGSNYLHAGRIYCVDETDGHLIWQTNEELTSYGTPIIVEDIVEGVVKHRLIIPRSYDLDSGAAIDCFDAGTGLKLWSRALGNRFGGYNGKLLTACGNIVVAQYKSYYPNPGTWYSGIFAVDVNNNGLWQIDWPASSVHRNFDGSTTDGENFYILCSSAWYSQTTNWIWAINALTGEMIWEKVITSTGRGSQPALDDTILYVPIANKTYCFDKATGIITKELLVPAAPVSIAGSKLLSTTYGTVKMYDAASGVVEWMYPIGGGTLALNPITVANQSFYAFTTQVNGKLIQFGLSNNPPISEAGDNLELQSDQVSTTILYGSASDLDNDVLVYRWLENNIVIQSDNPVSYDGICTLDLSTLSPLSIGQHTFILEIDDMKDTTRDSVVVTVENSPPVVPFPSSSTYSFGSTILIDLQLADYDGDNLYLTWSRGGEVFAENTIQTLPNGDPVTIPPQDVGLLPIGAHTITLMVSDGTVITEHTMIVQVVDVTAPTLHPQANTSILWPPNHELVEIIIQANAQDDSGQVNLAAVVSSSEPLNKGGDGNTDFDYTAPVVHEDGTITFQLRSERSGKGAGRIYNITIFASDISGNVTQAELQIIAPHSKNK